MPGDEYLSRSGDGVLPVAVGGDDSRAAEHHDRVVGHAGEVEHHLVDLGLAVAAHAEDLVFERVEHGYDGLGVVSLRQVVARAVVQHVAEQEELVGRLFFIRLHELGAPAGGAVDVGGYHQFHSAASFTAKRAATSGSKPSVYTISVCSNQASTMSENFWVPASWRMLACWPIYMESGVSGQRRMIW